jgi:hypothetical protein
MSKVETSSSSGSSSCLVELQVTPGENRRVWGAYGVAAEDGSLSWATYPDPESAKSDRSYTGRARIVRLRMEDVGTECQRELNNAESFRRPIEKAEGR